MHKNVRKSHFLMSLIVLSVMLSASIGVARGQDALPIETMGGWQPGPDAYHPGRIIVRFSDAFTTNNAADSIQRLGYSVYRVADFKPTAAFPSGVRFGIVEVPEEVGPDAAISRLGDCPGILYAERDYVYYGDQVDTDALTIPNDTHFGKTWGLHNHGCQHKDPEMTGNPVDDADIDAPEAWAVTTGSGEVVVAVIDTGIYVDHPDLNANIWRNPDEIPGNGIDDDNNGYIDDIYGWDFFNNDATVFDPNDGDQHGTHCAGTIGAVGNNTMGVPGVNWNVKIMSLKFLGPGGGDSSDAILALQYAHDKGAKVINCSWGGGGYSQSLKDAIEASGAIVCCAAGNVGRDTDKTPHYPSSFDSENIISVAAMMQNEMPCRYRGWWNTSYGLTSVDLFAPGGYILSTVPPPNPLPPDPCEAYSYFYGTSMATPHVSGAAALMAGFYPDMPLYRERGIGEGVDTVKGRILGNVDVFPQYKGFVLTGGRLNVANAIIAGGAPIVTSIEASPRWGSPPLQVNLRAAATTPEGEIVDKWWDFGDGSETVHDWEAVHIYKENGVYNASFNVVNDAGLPASATVQIDVRVPPAIGVEPTEVHTRLRWGESCEEPIAISNSGEAELDYTIGLELIGMVDTSGDITHIKGHASGGPEECGCFWMDSDQPGVRLPWWEDIRSIGTQILTPPEGWYRGIVVDLPFEFPFFGQTKTRVDICALGYLTFSDGQPWEWRNTPLPNPAEPNDLLAAFWDTSTLGFNERSGTCHYYSDDEVFIVQYSGVSPDRGFLEPPEPGVPLYGEYTYQVRLTRGGTITYHYKTMTEFRARANEASLGTRDADGVVQGHGFIDGIDYGATIGVENADGTLGLQASYCDDYYHDDLAAFFMPGWVTVNKTGGTVRPGESDTLTATFAAHNLPQGTWKARIKILSNDPANPQVDVDAFMFAKSIIPPVIRSISADPWAGSAPLTVKLSAAPEDIDGEIVGIKWDFGDGSDPATGTLEPIHTYSAKGEYTATLVVTDDDGLTGEATVKIAVKDLPQASVDPAAFCQTIRAHRERTETLTVTNTGEAPLAFTVKTCTMEAAADNSEPGPLGAGGPDAFGYVWVDSDEAYGPVFDWIDIRDVGTWAQFFGSGQYPVDLPFGFPFYGEVKSRVWICSYGYMTFQDNPSLGHQNKIIPDPGDPNDMLAVYWRRNASLGGDRGVIYYYDETNDRFIVQWNKTPSTFQAILYRDGTILYQYLDMPPRAVYTIGIENSDATDGLLVAYNKRDYVHNRLAIRIEPYYWLRVAPDEGTLEPGESTTLAVTFDTRLASQGRMDRAIALETNDIRKPRTIVPVHIDVIPNSRPVIATCAVSPEVGPAGTEFHFVAAAHDTDGHITDSWWDFGDGSDLVHGFAAAHKYTREGKFVATFTAVDNDRYRASAPVAVTVCEPASADWTPKQFSVAVGAGQSAEAILTLRNAGTGALLFGGSELSDRFQFPEKLAPPDGIKDPHALTAEGMYEPTAALNSCPWTPDGIGSVITRWKAPSPICWPWGVAVISGSGDLVISDPSTKPPSDHIVTAEGVHTGTSWGIGFNGWWGADMTFDGQYLWQVNVGGDNAIHKMDPETGQVIGSISNPEWTKISQRGLAYNPNDDTFYIGGWNENTIYKIKGESWNHPGEVIDSWAMPRIAGLAYHPAANLLAVTTNEVVSMVFFVDPDSHNVIMRTKHPGEDMFAGAGCDFAASGDLWVSSQDNNHCMYLIETGLGPLDSTWVSWTPDHGSIPAGGSVDITVDVDASKLPLGTLRGNVTLFTNDIENPMIIVPVVATVTAPPNITEASADPVLGEPPLEVSFHAAFEAPGIPVASYGWSFGDGTSSTELDVTHAYTEPGKYTAVFSAVDQIGAHDQAIFEIEVRWLPRATIEPSVIEVTLPPQGSTVQTVTLGNVEGNADLRFDARVRSGGAPVVALPERIGIAADPIAQTAEGLYSVVDPELVERIAASIEPGAVGDVITSWPAPSPIRFSWGVGFDGHVWIADPESKKDHVVTTGGVHTGTVFDTPWAEAWAADMAYDPNHNLMWQVGVAPDGGDNGIYGMDPKTGAVVMSIRNGPWTNTSQRGLAYNAENDTFYVGGWNEDIIYHINGPNHSDPGSVIETYRFPVGIAGLAWHPDGILWVSNNGEPDMIFGVDLDALRVVYQFQHPFHGNNVGSGLALNSDGNLWVASMGDTHIYLVNTEMPIVQGVVIDPVSGTVIKGETTILGVTINAKALGKPGDDVTECLEITTNDPEKAIVYVDLIVHIEAGPTIVQATATPTIGEPPLKVELDANIEPGATDIVDIWWDFGDGSDLAHEACVEHVYNELGVYEAFVHAVDKNEVEVSARVPVTVKWLPVLQIEPERLDEIVPVGGEKQTVLKIKNTGVGPMSFQIAVAEGSEDGADQSPSSRSILKANPASGYLVSGGTQDVVLTLGSVDAARGIYSFRLELSTDDPYRPLVAVPVKLKINASPTGDLTAPVGGDTWAGRQEIKWTAADPDDPADALTVDLYWSRDGGEWHEIAKGLANTGSYMWNTAGVGLGGDAFRVRIVATDPAGQPAEVISESFTILNDAPTAAFSFSPSPATVTSIVEFVDESTDDGDIVAWHWEFGDGAESTERNPKHQYSAKRTFTVKLTVTDDGGLTGVCEKQIHVVNAAPTVRILKPEAGETWTKAREIEYEASDPDGDPLAIKLEYDYLGDESGWQLIADGQENTGKYLWDTSKLAKGGRYKVRVAAADPDGGVAEAVSGEFTIIVLRHMAMAAPNPARNSVMFYYDIESDAAIYVYDVAGRLVYTADLAAGTNAHEWNLTTSGRPVAAGLYLYAVVTTDGVKSEVGRLVIER